MRTAEELIRDANIALEKEDFDQVVAILCEALAHLQDFSWRTGVTWQWEEVKDCCHEIGERLYDRGGFEAMEQCYKGVHRDMKHLAARYLERSWHGCGDGAWLG